MSNHIEIKVPDIGDFSDVEVIELLVEVGQTIGVEDSLITIETDKAAMDIPSTHAGTVTSIGISAGDKVSEGHVILTLESEAASETEQAPATPSPEPTEAPSPEPTEMVAAVSPSDAKTVAMPSLVEIKIPNLGDFDDVEVIEVLIKPGDQIELEAPLLTLETDKATMDVPSEVTGVIKEVLVSVGDRVKVGATVAICESTGAAAPSEPAPDQTAAPAPQPASAPAAVSAPVASPAAGAAPAALPPISEKTFKQAHASPSVRKFARELGVDLGRVKGSGVKSRINQDDIKAFVKSFMMGGGAAPAGSALPELPTVDHSKFGNITLQPLTRIQKISGPRLHASWVNIPHVTQNDLGDFTDTEARRQTMKGPAREQGVKLTPLAFVVRACVVALQEFPLFNASLSDDGTAMVMKDFINIGFAAETPNGLMVPVIHNAQTLSLMDIAKALSELSEKARDGKLKAKEMQGGSFTVSSLGGIGGTSFTPIINPPEVAILGVSRSSMQPVYIDGEFVPRLLLPLSLSYDHRVIDGASAARFTARLAQLVADVDVLVDA